MKSDTNNRQEKGREIALNPNVQILRINDYTYHVKSQTTNREYDVVSTEKGGSVDALTIHTDMYVASIFTLSSLALGFENKCEKKML